MALKVGRRAAFSEKYGSLAERWKICGNHVGKLIDKYSNTFTHERQQLKQNEFCLPKFYKDRRTDEEYPSSFQDGDQAIASADLGS